MNRKTLKDLLKVLGGTITGAATLHAYYKDTKDISNVKVLEELLDNTEALQNNIIQNQNSSMELLKDQIASANKLSTFYKNKLIELTGDTRIPDAVKSEIYKAIKKEYNPDFSQPSTSMASAVEDYLANKADSGSDSDSKVNNLLSNFNIND
jgi:hypothetical protein